MLSIVRTLKYSLNTPSVIRKMSQLLQQMNATWEKGIASNDLVVFQSDLKYVKDHNYDVYVLFLFTIVQFIVRCLTSDMLKKKGSNLKSTEKKIDDPFSKENRNRTLIVHEYSDHTLLLNKFPVLKNHVLFKYNLMNSVSW